MARRVLLAFEVDDFFNGALEPKAGDLGTPTKGSLEDALNGVSRLVGLT
jgi:hypothetical protein